METPDPQGTTVSAAPRGFWQRQLRPTADERRVMRRRQVWIFLVFCYLAGIFAYIWPPDWRNPSTPYVLAFSTAFMIRTFVFHGGMLVAVVALFAAWKRRSRVLLATLPLLLVSLGPSVAAYLRPAPSASAQTDATVMSVNLLMINRQTAPLLDEIEAEAPDILLLQEYTDDWHKAFQQRLGLAYPYGVYQPRDDSFGAAIYSRHPFVGKVQRYLPLGMGSEPQMRAVVRLGDRELAVYNLHLLPPRSLDYIVENRRQFADLLDILTDEQLPIIMGGDFNFTETSPNASALADLGLGDAHSAAGWGRGATWPVLGFFRWIPGLQLDHIYVRGALRPVACRTGQGKGSDHRPVIVRLATATAAAP